MGLGNLFKLHRDGDRALQLLLLNEEFLVIAGHQPAMITSLPFEKKRVYYYINSIVDFTTVAIVVVVFLNSVIIP